jgi:hypothetical protein
MTNKRITELTALDGDDVADNDVLAIVDVSDTTMAASGTTKKITVAELVTDSALTNKFWPNSSTALTGANLANGDKLAVVDVGSPDVPKYITADELAQGSQFSSRFVPKADDTILVNAGAMGTNTAATLTIATASYSYTAWLLDSASLEIVSGMVTLPSWWSTYHVDLMYSNAGAGSGNIRIGMQRLNIADGNSVNAESGTSLATYTVPSRDVFEVQRTFTSASAATSPHVLFNVFRDGSAVEDTLGNDIAVWGVLFTRAS